MDPIFDADAIIEYARSDEREMCKAASLFFDKIPKNEDEMKFGLPLFAEWYIFEYKRSWDSPTFISEYYLKNPDNLPQEKLKIIRQIVESHYFSMINFIDKNDKQFNVIDLIRNKKYIIENDFSFDNRNVLKHSFVFRIAHINNQWKHVGGPLVGFVTQASRKTLFATKGFDKDKFTPEFVFKLLYRREPKTNHEI